MIFFTSRPCCRRVIATLVVYHSAQRLTAKTTTMSTAIITSPENTSTGVTVMAPTRV